MYRFSFANSTRWYTSDMPAEGLLCYLGHNNFLYWHCINRHSDAWYGCLWCLMTLALRVQLWIGCYCQTAAKGRSISWQNNQGNWSFHEQLHQNLVRNWHFGHVFCLRGWQLIPMMEMEQNREMFIFNWLLPWLIVQEGLVVYVVKASRLE